MRSQGLLATVSKHQVFTVGQFSGVGKDGISGHKLRTAACEPIVEDVDASMGIDADMDVDTDAEMDLSM